MLRCYHEAEGMVNTSEHDPLMTWWNAPLTAVLYESKEFTTTTPRHPLVQKLYAEALQELSSSLLKASTVESPAAFATALLVTACPFDRLMEANAASYATLLMSSTARSKRIIDFTSLALKRTKPEMISNSLHLQKERM